MNSYIDKTIVSMRKSNSYIKTILNFVTIQCPNIDEVVCLGRVLSVLDKEGVAVSRNEVRVAFNRYYNKKYHGEKKGYMAWLCTEFHIKRGTIVNSSKIRSQTKNKTPIPQTYSPNNAPRMHNLDLNDKRHTKRPKVSQNSLKQPSSKSLGIEKVSLDLYNNKQEKPLAIGLLLTQKINVGDGDERE